MSPKIISLIIFISAYVLFIFLPHKRTLVAIVAATALVLAGALSLTDAFLAIDWNVMGIFVGTLALAAVFMKSRMPAYLAEIIVNRAKNTCWAILLICLMTGLISAFVENVATVLIVAPIALSVAKKLKINPMSMLIAIAVSSNLQGTATLIGDPPSMLLGSFARMNFGDFFFFHGRPGIFFAVEIGAFFSFFVLYYLFRRHREKIVSISVEKVVSWFPSLLLVLLIVLLAASSFIKTDFRYLAGSICMLFGATALFWNKLFNRGSIRKEVRSLDWETTFFLAGVFVLVGSITQTGWIASLAAWLSGIIGQNIFWGYILIVVISVLASAVIDNVPFLVAMLPLATSLSADLGIPPYLFLFGLLIGASIGGNITPIGASANIVACGLLKKEGYHVSFADFMKIGIPFTLAAVIPACLFIWLVWR